MPAVIMNASAQPRLRDSERAKWIILGDVECSETDGTARWGQIHMHGMNDGTNTVTRDSEATSMHQTPWWWSHLLAFHFLSITSEVMASL